jgi:hypothetical protein
MGYVYRYAGMLEKSTIECTTALALDPGNFSFRSCAWAFMELGKTDRARDFIRLDAGSEWAAYVTPSLFLREGKVQEARECGKSHADRADISPRSAGGLSAIAAGGDLDRMAQQAETSLPAEPDPETWYYQGAIFAYCGKKQAALPSAAERDRAELLCPRESAFRSRCSQNSANFDKVLTGQIRPV